MKKSKVKSQNDNLKVKTFDFCSVFLPFYFWFLHFFCFVILHLDFCFLTFVSDFVLNISR